MEQQSEVLCIGAGPAGLTAAYLLSKRGRSVTVLEADPRYVGGISRTVDYQGFLIDIGGHRFFSKSREVEDLWTELLAGDMLDCNRKTRILYRGKFYDYPLRAANALKQLGLFNSAACVLSYFKARMFPYRPPANFEEWVVNQFGRRLFSTFFETYTEKVWGMKCTEISADWAAQRINRLTLGTAILNALKPRPKTSPREGVIKTLIDRFRYPRRGPGMLWEEAARRIAAQGGKVKMGRRVTGLTHCPETARWRVAATTPDGETETHTASHVISSAPMRDLFAMLEPAPRAAASGAAAALRYRDFLIVGLIARDRAPFDDNWIYIHDDRVKVGRIENFKNWSTDMVPDPDMVCYGMEYFCFEGDRLWHSSDDELIALARTEIATLGLVEPEDIVDGVVVRQRKAYPVYDDAYGENVAILRRAVADSYPGLHLVGRAGMHKYNNQDHAMMTAMLTVDNILAGKTIYDVWRVNQDAEYHEAGAAGQDTVLADQRAVPGRAA
ncbi:MAG: NAD(P)/FAD-dependent oxidoreductase [Alphaproteobacteria bacterium]|nr:NAD(P)/FAD-dependent oxidoreductase [Alphaproteobacteria bacterium]